MVIYANGNIFDYNADAIVNPVNTVGVMGKGLALEFKKRFPVNYKLYKEACNNGTMRIGKVYTTHKDASYIDYIINFPTKQHWNNSSKIEWIEAGLKDLRREIEEKEIYKILIPALGCGLGGLEWGIVNKAMVEEFKHCKADIYIFPPQNTYR